MKQDWDDFWERKNKGLLSRFLGFYRIQIIGRAINYYINTYFKPEGIFVECGSGTSETTLKTIKKKRTFIAIDYSTSVLEYTRLKIPLPCMRKGQLSIQVYMLTTKTFSHNKFARSCIPHWLTMLNLQFWIRQRSIKSLLCFVNG